MTPEKFARANVELLTQSPLEIIRWVIPGQWPCDWLVEMNSFFR